MIAKPITYWSLSATMALATVSLVVLALVLPVVSIDTALRLCQLSVSSAMLAIMFMVMVASLKVLSKTASLILFVADTGASSLRQLTKDQEVLGVAQFKVVPGSSNWLKEQGLVKPVDFVILILCFTSAVVAVWLPFMAPSTLFLAMYGLVSHVTRLLNFISNLEQVIDDFPPAVSQYINQSLLRS